MIAQSNKCSIDIAIFYIECKNSTNINMCLSLMQQEHITQKTRIINNHKGVTYELC